MKEQIIRFFKMWTLPLGMFAGVGVYLMFHYIPWLSPLKVLAKGNWFAVWQWHCPFTFSRTSLIMWWRKGRWSA